MDVATMTMDPVEAQVQLDTYRSSIHDRHRTEKEAVEERIRKEDQAVEEMLSQLAKGRPILDLHESMQLAGCDGINGYPRLAISRADQPWAYFAGSGNDYFFGPTRWSKSHQSRLWIRVPKQFLPGCTIGHGKAPWEIRAVVPTIPPRFRPSTPLENFHILWEAEWQSVPKDPILLRRIRGHHYAVLAQWDLTEIERAVLAARPTP